MHRDTSEVRFMVYQFLIGYDEILFDKRLDNRNVDPRRDGLWLQHNPRNNPLAIMPVSRQVYNEAREVFYSLNKFSFESSAALSVFLIGIGPRNAMVLRSVWQKNEQHHWENVTPIIRQCLSSAMFNSVISKPEAVAGYVEQYRHIVYNHWPEPLPRYSHESSRLVRPEMANSLSTLDRWRYKIYARAWKRDQLNRRLCWEGKAVFELCVQRGRDVRARP